MTPEQRELLADKVALWRTYGQQGATDIRPYNLRAADALQGLIDERDALLVALEDFDNWFCGFNPDNQASRMEGRKVVIRARAAIAKAVQS